MRIGVVEDPAHCGACEIRSRTQAIFGKAVEAEDNDPAAAGAMMARHAYILGVVSGLARTAVVSMCQSCFAEFKSARVDLLGARADAEIPKSTLCACERCRNAN